MELSNSNIKKLLTYSQKKAVLIFQETKTSKNFLIFPKKETFSYISGNRNAEKIIYISGNGNFLYFRKALARPENQKFLILLLYFSL